MRVEWILEPAEFAAIAEPWDRLAATARSPFMRQAWLRCWWTAFTDEARPAVCTLWDGEDLAGGLPLLRDGRTVRAMANDHTPRFAALARDAGALDRLADEAVRRGGAELRLAGVPEDDPLLPSLGRASARGRRRWVVEPESVSLVTETDGPLGAYRARMRPNFREIERRRRKLAREHEVRWQLVERPADLDAELEAGLRVEASGWKGREGTAIRSDERVHRFYRSIAHAFAADDELRFSTLTMDGEPVAWDFALLSDGRYWLLKTAYDEAQARLGPGMALRLSVIERCFELGLAAHEFLGVAMEWKRRFATSERALVTARSYAPRPVPAARGLYRARLRPLAREVRDRLRQRGSDG